MLSLGHEVRLYCRGRSIEHPLGPKTHRGACSHSKHHHSEGSTCVVRASRDFSFFPSL